jgi:hypothetical protein
MRMTPGLTPKKAPCLATAYMSPEQAEQAGGHVPTSSRSVLLYEMLSGRRAFDG